MSRVTSAAALVIRTAGFGLPGAARSFIVALVITGFTPNPCKVVGLACYQDAIRVLSVLFGFAARHWR